MKFYTNKNSESIRSLNASRELCKTAIIALGYESEETCFVLIDVYFYDHAADRSHYCNLRFPAESFVKMTTDEIAARIAALAETAEKTYNVVDLQRFAVYIDGGIALELTDENFCTD